ncbi:hypothetical protein TGCAST_313340 [Toxoplasma gondii CAST]|uniref:Uncharacterized protein n=1 Tax=Toxoplasma gondii CAST TaxID=943122 RepID=A0A425I1Y0_TOXGO|nr:hypothetical protein TGCAST_313340 [Toxoplasma gondii CAST]
MSSRTCVVNSPAEATASETATLPSSRWTDFPVRMAPPSGRSPSASGPLGEETVKGTGEETVRGDTGSEGVRSPLLSSLASKLQTEEGGGTLGSREFFLSEGRESKSGRRGKFGFSGLASERNDTPGDVKNSVLREQTTLQSLPSSRSASLPSSQRSGGFSDRFATRQASENHSERVLQSANAEEQVSRSLVKDEHVVQFILQEICEVAKDCKSDLDDLIHASGVEGAWPQPMSRLITGGQSRASRRRGTPSSIISPLNTSSSIGFSSERGSTEGVERQIKQLHAFLTHELLPSVDRAKAEADTLRRSNAVLSEKLKRSEEQRQRQTEQIDDLQDECRRSQFESRHHLSEAVEKLKAENFHLKSQLDLTEKHLRDERKDNATLEQKFLALEKKTKENKESIESMEATALRDQLNSVQREVKRLTTLSSQKDSMIEDLKEVVRVARGETAAMSSRALSRSSHGTVALNFPREGREVSTPLSALASDMALQMKLRMTGGSVFPGGAAPATERFERRKEFQRSRRCSMDFSNSRVRHQESLAAELLDSESGKAGEFVEERTDVSAAAVSAGDSALRQGSAPAGSIQGVHVKEEEGRGRERENPASLAGSGATSRAASTRGETHALCERRTEALQHELEELKKNHAQLLDRNEILKKYNDTLEKHFEAELLQYVKKDDMDRVQTEYQAAKQRVEDLCERYECAQMEREDTQEMERHTATMVDREEVEKMEAALRKEKDAIAKEKETVVQQLTAEKDELERRKDGEIAKLCGEIATLESQVKTAEAEREKMTQLLEKEKKDKTGLGNRLAALEAAAEETAALKEVLEQEKEARGNLDKSRIQREAELLARQKEVAKLSEEVKALQAEQATKQADAEKELKAKDEEVLQTKERLNSALSEVESLRRKHTLQQEVLAKTTRELEVSRGKEAALQEEATTLRSQLDKAVEERREMAKTLDAAQAARAVDQRTLEEKQRELERVENRAKNVESGRDQVEARLAESAAECTALSRTCAMLKEEVDTIRQKREKDLSAFRTRLQQKNSEKKKQILQMLEVNENLAMRKEEMETRFVDQLQDARSDIDRLIGLQMRQPYMRRGSQLSLPGPPKDLSSFASQMWHMHESKADSLPGWTDRTSSLKSSRKTHRSVAMYRPVALSIQNLVPHSPRGGTEKSRTRSGSGDSLGDEDSDLLDFIPDLVSKIRSKLFKGQNSSESNSREQLPLLREESTSSASEMDGGYTRQSSSASSRQRSGSVDSSGSFADENTHFVPAVGLSKSRPFLRSLKTNHASGTYPPMVAMWEPTVDETTDNAARFVDALEEDASSPVLLEHPSSPLVSADSLPAIRVMAGSVFGTFPGQNQQTAGVWREMEEIRRQKGTLRKASTLGNVAELRSDNGLDKDTEKVEKDTDESNRKTGSFHAKNQPQVEKRTRRPRELMNYIDVESRTFYTPRRR